ncbi:MAG: hypothetical protein JWM12_1539 [Ilumatobacteraceae bacterium]|nr:hypothetical protein [Ilumatobacteraceae bacterium]
MSLSRGRQLWLSAGQELLRRGGVAAVKLQALTEELLLTTGSFYHHFTSMRDFLEQLADHYGADQATSRLEVTDDPDPRARLRRLLTLAQDDRLGRLDSAMRDWAGSNPRAARAVDEADGQVLQFLEGVFRDLGHRGRAAQLRAQLIFAMSVSRVSPPWPPEPQDVEDTIDILIAPFDHHDREPLRHPSSTLAQIPPVVERVSGR